MSKIAVLAILHKWRLFCSVSEQRHDAARAYFRFLNHAIMISSIIMSGFASASSLAVASKDNCSSNTDTVLIVFSSINILSATLISIHRFMGLAELQHDHDLYSDLFDCLSKDIDMHVSLAGGTFPMFTSIDEFAKHCKSRMDIMIDKGPAIPGFIIKKYPILDDTIDELMPNIPHVTIVTTEN